MPWRPFPPFSSSPAGLSSSFLLAVAKGWQPSPGPQDLRGSSTEAQESQLPHPVGAPSVPCLVAASSWEVLSVMTWAGVGDYSCRYQPGPS